MTVQCPVTIPRPPQSPSPGSASPEQPQSRCHLAALVTRPSGRLLTGCAVPTKGPSAPGCPPGNDRRKGGADMGSAGGTSLTPPQQSQASPARAPRGVQLNSGRPPGSSCGSDAVPGRGHTGHRRRQHARATPGATAPFAWGRSPGSSAGTCGPVTGLSGARHQTSDLDKFTLAITALRVLGMQGDVRNLTEGVFGIDENKRPVSR